MNKILWILYGCILAYFGHILHVKYIKSIADKPCCCEK